MASNKWRPPEWNKHYQVLSPDNPDEAFEAGADEMLKALRSIARQDTVVFGDSNTPGRMVFIPDD